MSYYRIPLKCGYKIVGFSELIHRRECLVPSGYGYRACCGSGKVSANDFCSISPVPQDAYEMCCLLGTGFLGIVMEEEHAKIYMFFLIFESSGMDFSSVPAGALVSLFLSYCAWKITPCGKLRVHLDVFVGQRDSHSAHWGFPEAGTVWAGRWSLPRCWSVLVGASRSRRGNRSSTHSSVPLWDPLPVGDTATSGVTPWWGHWNQSDATQKHSPTGITVGINTHFNWSF